MGCITTILPSLSLSKSCGPALCAWHLSPALAQVFSEYYFYTRRWWYTWVWTGLKRLAKTGRRITWRWSSYFRGHWNRNNYHCWLINDLSFKLHTIRHSSVMTDENYGKLRVLVLKWIIFTSCNWPTDTSLYRNYMQLQDWLLYILRSNMHTGYSISNAVPRAACSCIHHRSYIILATDSLV